MVMTNQTNVYTTILVAVVVERCRRCVARYPVQGKIPTLQRSGPLGKLRIRQQSVPTHPYQRCGMSQPRQRNLIAVVVVFVSGNKWWSPLSASSLL